MCSPTKYSCPPIFFSKLQYLYVCMCLYWQNLSCFLLFQPKTENVRALRFSLISHNINQFKLQNRIFKHYFSSKKRKYIPPPIAPPQKRCRPWVYIYNLKVSKTQSAISSLLVGICGPNTPPPITKVLVTPLLARQSLCRNQSDPEETHHISVSYSIIIIHIAQRRSLIPHFQII